MPSRVKFGEREIEMGIEIIRYNKYNSQSGAYIFAPGSNGKQLNLKPLDVFFLNS
jgi:hypothetical protein